MMGKRENIWGVTAEAFLKGERKEGRGGKGGNRGIPETIGPDDTTNGEGEPRRVHSIHKYK